MGLTRYYKMEGFFTFKFAVFLPNFMLFLLVTLVSQAANLFSYQISMKYLNPWLR